MKILTPPIRGATGSASALRACLKREGEAPAEPNTTAGRRPPEAPFHASGGRRAIARIRLGGSLALPKLTF